MQIDIRVILQTLRPKIAAWYLLFDLCRQPAIGQPQGDACRGESSPTANVGGGEEVGTGAIDFRPHQSPQVAVSPEPNLHEFATSIEPILKEKCVPCHGEDAQEGNLRIDTLDPDLVHGNDIDWWLEVQAVLSNSEMPPPDEVELADADRACIIEWLSNEIQIASIARRASGEHSSFRRMTRYEFNYALQDLLGLPYDFARDLPPEANSEDGFQNSSEPLHMSVSQLETYRRLARKALLRATVRGERPPVLYWGVNMKDAGRIDWAKQEAQFEQAKAETAGDRPPTDQRLSTRAAALAVSR